MEGHGSFLGVRQFDEIMLVLDDVGLEISLISGKIYLAWKIVCRVLIVAGGGVGVERLRVYLLKRW